MGEIMLLDLAAWIILIVIPTLAIALAATETLKTEEQQDVE